MVSHLLFLPRQDLDGRHSLSNKRIASGGAIELVRDKRIAYLGNGEGRRRTIYPDGIDRNSVCTGLTGLRDRPSNKTNGKYSTGEGDIRL